MDTNNISRASNTSVVKYKLQYPINYGSQVIAELTISRPKLRDFKQMDTASNDIAKTTILLSKICKDEAGNCLTPGMFDEIDIVDLKGINKIIEDFQGESPKT